MNPATRDGPQPPERWAAFSLRPMTLEDYDAVFDLWRRCEGIGLGDSDAPSAIADYLARNPGMSAVAIDAASGTPRRGAIVGAVLCGHDGRRGTLHHLAVEPSHRRRGIARALTQWCLDRLLEAGIPKCNLFLWRDNADGAAFWTRDGWSAREDLVVMQRWTAFEER